MLAHLKMWAERWKCGQSSIYNDITIFTIICTEALLPTFSTLCPHFQRRPFRYIECIEWALESFLLDTLGHMDAGASPGSLYQEVYGIYCPEPVLLCGKFVETKRQASFQLEDLPDDQARLNLFSNFPSLWRTSRLLEPCQLKMKESVPILGRPLPLLHQMVPFGPEDSLRHSSWRQMRTSPWYVKVIEIGWKNHSPSVCFNNPWKRW